MALVTSNSQGELSPLERGLHAFAASGNHGDTKRYADSIGRPRSSVRLEEQAGRVAKSCTCNLSELQEKTRHLAEIHALPDFCWQTADEAIVAQMGFLAELAS